MPASVLDAGVELMRSRVDLRAPWPDAFFLAVTDPGSTTEESSRWDAVYLFLRFAPIGLWVSFLVPRMVERVKRSRNRALE